MSFFRRKRSSDSSDPDESRERWRNSVGLKNFRPSLGGDENTTYGIKEWAAGENPNVDIVFIHGLNGHCERTWRADNGIIWPKELLPHEVPRARILTYGYDSRFHASKQLSHQTFHGHATTLLQKLSLHRRADKPQTVRRPLIFVAHSLGGLVLKNALIYSNLASRDHIEHYKAISNSTYGIMFFGTPHHGGNGVSLGKLVANVVSIVHDTNKALLDHLKKDSESLEQQLEQYTLIADQFVTKFCYETVKTTRLGFSMMVVDKSSAIVRGQSNAESIEIHKSHTEMVRMKSAKDNDYQTIAMHVQLMCEAATQKIDDRWNKCDGVYGDLAVITMLPDRELPRISGRPVIENDYNLTLQLGYKPNSQFTGRAKVLESLHSLLTNSNVEKRLQATTVVVLGIGGVGKTQCVRQYAYRYCSQYTSISWINGTSLETTYAGFHELARRLIRHYSTVNKASIPPYTNLAQHLGIPGLIDGDGEISFNHKTRSSVVEAVKNWFSAANNNRWLVIFDNVDDLESFDIGDFLPTAAENGKILMTSRRRECSRFGEELELDVMEKLESIELLQCSCKRTFTAQEREEANLIVERLGRLPLAIDMAGAYLHTMRKPLASYLPLLHHTSIKGTLSKKPPASVWQYGKDVFSTWEMSIEEIQTKHPKAAELLTLCSFLSNGEIQTELLERGLSIVDPQAIPLDETTSPLLSFSLITRTVATGDLTIHPLIQDWARERLSCDHKAESARKAFRMVCNSLRVWEIWTTGVRKPEDWQYERRITPHIEMVLSWVQDILSQNEVAFEHAPELMMLANVYYYEGRYSEAEKLYLGVFHQRESKLGTNHPDTLAVAQGLATINRFQGKWNECQKLYERVLDGRKKIDPNHLDTLATVQSLAVLYRHKGRLADSVKLYQWALYGIDGCGNGIERQQGPTHPNTIHTVFGYAIVLQHQGKYEQSLILYEQVLAQRKTKLGAKHPDTLTVMQNHADASRRIGRLESAEKLFREVLDARENYLGSLHPDTLRTAEGLANVYRDQNRFEKAEKLYAQVLNGREQKLGFEHADTLATIHNVADSYRMQGKLDEANTLYLRALESREREGNLGPNHLDTLRTVEGLGRVAEDQKRYSEAEIRYRRVLAGFKEQMPEDCPDMVRALENMARITEKLGRHKGVTSQSRLHSSISNSETIKDEAEMERMFHEARLLRVSSNSDSTREHPLEKAQSNSYSSQSTEGSELDTWRSNSSRNQSVTSESIMEESETESCMEGLRGPGGRLLSETSDSLMPFRPHSRHQSVTSTPPLAAEKTRHSVS